MKKLLLIASLLAVALAGCTKREEPEVADEPAELSMRAQLVVNGKPTKMVRIQSLTPKQALGEGIFRVEDADGICYGSNIRGEITPLSCIPKPQVVEETPDTDENCSN